MRGETATVVINEDGADIDFRVESDTNANALFMDASTSYVGINRSPSVELDVQRISTSYPLRISASDGSARTMVFADSAGSPSRVNWLAGAQYNTDNGWELTPSTANGGYTFTNRILTAYANGNLTVNENGIDADFRVESDNSSAMLFVDASTDRVGVGVAAPNNTLDVQSSDTNAARIRGVSNSPLYSYGDGGGVGWATGPGTSYGELIYLDETNSKISLYTGGAQRFVIGAAETIFNDIGADTDFRVESDAKSHAIFMNAANGTVAFGAATPETATSFIGAGGIYINNGNQPSGDFMSIDAEGASGGTTMTFYRYDSSAAQYQNRLSIAGETAETVVNDTGLDVDFRVESSTTSQALNVDGATGNIGFGTNLTTNYGQTSGTGTLAYKTDNGSEGGSLMVSNNADRGWANIYLNKFAWNSGDDTRVMQFYINATDDSATLEYDGTNFAIVNPSDYRLKENVVSYTGGLAKINAIGVKSFNKIDGISSHITQEGFIAHELKAVIPLAVIGEKDSMKTNESGEVVPDYQRVNKETLIPYLVSAIQELSAKVETLESRIAALES